MPWPLFPREGIPIPIVQEAEWDTVPIWMSVEKRKSFSPPLFEPQTAHPAASTILTVLSHPLSQ